MPSNDASYQTCAEGDPLRCPPSRRPHQSRRETAISNQSKRVISEQLKIGGDPESAPAQKKLGPIDTNKHQDLAPSLLGICHERPFSAALFRHLSDASQDGRGGRHPSEGFGRGG